jgi:ubiquinone/menaquinone biosynthesis C-methylase UbiE
MSDPKELLDYYSRSYTEAERLTGGLGALERVRIRELIARHLPAPPAVVCDVGGGPGAHSFWLAGLGHEVHLVDAVPRHIEQAGEAAENESLPRLASLEVGDARNLSYPEEFADAVLLHGPLYHLTDREDRLRAIGESRRVLRPGGVLFACAISRYASTIVGLVRGWVWDADYHEMIRRELTTGQHRKPPGWNVFIDAFFHHPEELRAELEEAGMEHEETLGIQGPGWLVPEFEESLEDGERMEIILDIARLMEREPVLSPHLMAIARRPARSQE